MKIEKKYLNGELLPMYGGTAKRTVVARKSQTSDQNQMAEDNLQDYVQNHMDCNPNSSLAGLSTSPARTLDKVERIANQGEVSRTALWLYSGYGRWFAEGKDKDGLPVDETIDFFRPGKILVIGECFFNDYPSLFNVELAAGSVVIDFPRHFYDALKIAAPEAETLATKILATDRLEGLEKIIMVRKNTRARYKEFLRIFGPEIEQYFAVKHIASYLAMQPSYLSRIRAEYFKK